MRWDDWLFIVMFFGVVPGAITLFGRALAKGSPWHQLPDAIPEKFGTADWKKVSGIQIGTSTNTTTIRGLAKIAVVDGHLIIRPGIFARYLGFRPKAIGIDGCSFKRASEAIRVKAGNCSFQLKFVPMAVAVDLLQK